MQKAAVRTGKYVDACQPIQHWLQRLGARLSNRVFPKLTHAGDVDVVSPVAG